MGRPIPARAALLLMSLPKLAVSGGAAPVLPSAGPSAPSAAPGAGTAQWWQAGRPTGDETSCLLPQPFGCHAITSELTCLGSRDGRERKEWEGLKIHGEPCVWCGGQACRSGSENKCEPLDFLMNGEGVGFTTFLAKLSYQAAKCKDGEPLPPKTLHAPPQLPTIAPIHIDEPAVITQPPDVLFPIHQPFDIATLPPMSPLPTLPADTATTPSAPAPATQQPTASPTRQPGSLPYNLTIHPTEAQMACLTVQENNCSSVHDEEPCLRSRDSGPGGSACVWCGGAGCRLGGARPCEALDVLASGGGAGLANTTFQVALCTGEGNPFGFYTPLFPWWVWLMILVPLCCIAVFVSIRWGERTGGKKKKPKKNKEQESRRTRRGSRSASGDSGGSAAEETASEDSAAEDSYASLEAPLVRGAPAEDPDLFDIIDKDHDGIITASEFAEAMGQPAPNQAIGTPASTQIVPMVMTNAQAVPTVMPNAAPVRGPAFPAFAARPPMEPIAQLTAMPSARNVQLVQQPFAPVAALRR